MSRQVIKGEARTIDELRDHYQIEKKLANRLRNASRQERRNLYSSLYDEMFKLVPLHPQLVRKSSPSETEAAVATQMNFIKPFLDNNTTFLEVGPGDCAIAFAVSRLAKQVYAVDVSDEITQGLTMPPNFQLMLSNGSNVPLPAHSIDVAYSNHLMEHLHPDDAFEHLKNIHHTLVHGGVYICITPNRLHGPHDISKYFDEVATGFHLKEYTTLELIRIFKKVGFSRVRVYIGAKGKYIPFPALPIVLFEILLDKIPYTLRKKIVSNLPFRLLLDIRIVGKK